MGDGDIDGKELGKGTEGREGSDRYWQVEGKEGRWELREGRKKGVEGEGEMGKGGGEGGGRGQIILLFVKT